MRVVIDIETIPCCEELRHLLPSDDEEHYRATALDPNLGRVFCIGILPLSDDVVPCEMTAIYGDSEKDVLWTFWEKIKSPTPPQLITHNGLYFDLPFIWKRSVINQVRPSMEVRLNRFRTDFVYDTMAVWSNWEPRARIKLEFLAQLLGVEEKSGSGEMVYELWKTGEWKKIAEYCLDDVYVTYACYCKMNFLNPTPKDRVVRIYHSVPPSRPAL